MKRYQRLALLFFIVTFVSLVVQTPPAVEHPLRTVILVLVSGLVFVMEE